MEHGDVARLFNVADADLRDYVVHDDSVLVLLTDDVQRLWTPDGVFAVNDCPQNRSLRQVPDHFKYAAGLDKVPDVAVNEEKGERLGGPVAGPVLVGREDGPELWAPEESPAEAEESEPSGEVPEGTADEVLSWVDGDPDRAALAIEAEEQREKPRSVLLGNLRKVSQA